jgi:hypothetical protein
MESLFCRIISWKNATIGKRRSKHGYANAEDMENRLEFFRQQMAAFDGAADPRGAIENCFYIEEPEHSATNQLFKRICLKPNSRNLLLGGIGSGKTTQLFRLERLLRDTDVHPYYVDVTSYEQLDMQEGLLLKVIFSLELIDSLTQVGALVDDESRNLIQKYAFGSIGNSLIAGQMTVPELSAYHPGVVSSLRSINQAHRIKTAFLTLVEQFENRFSKTPFFLLDGLDRINDVERFIRIASSVLEDGGCGFLIVGPLGMLYSGFSDGIDNLFDHFEYRSAFDVEKYTAARQFFKNILMSRSKKDFFQQPALEQVVRMSGGVLRDLINLTQEAIQEAYLYDSEKIDLQHVNRAVRSLGRAKILGLSDKESDILDRVVNSGEIIIPTSADEISLLASGRILEYRYPQRRFSAHPVLQALLSARLVA